MRHPRKQLIAVAATLATLCVVAGCSGATSGGGGNGGAAATLVEGEANAVNTGTATKGGTITYVLERNIEDWNPLNADIGVATQLVADAYDPQTFTTLPDLSGVEMNKDLLVSAEQVSDSPQVLVYKISPKAVWSDGTPISGADFEYTWKSQDLRYCPKCETATSFGYKDIKSMVASDGGKTVTVTLSTPFGDWQSMFSPLLPAHISKTLGNDGTPAGIATSFNDGFRYKNSFPKWSGGPFMIKSWSSNQAATLVPNPKWYGKPVTLKSLIFRVITDTTQEVPALKNNEVQVISPQPQVDLLRNVKDIKGVNYQLGPGLRKEQMMVNLNTPAMRSLPLRQALFIAVDVKQTIAKTVGQFDNTVKPLGNRIFVPQQPGYEDHLGDLGSGNVEKAKQLLKTAGFTVKSGKLIDPKGTAVPPLVNRFSQSNQIQQTECELFAASAKQLGVTIECKTTDSIGQTVTHQAGHDFDILTFTWVGQTFLSTQNAQAFMTKAGLNFGNYSSPTVDALLAKALTAPYGSKQVAGYLNAVDKQLNTDAYLMPLYQQPLLFVYKSSLVNIRQNGTYFGAPYNAGEWGIK